MLGFEFMFLHSLQCPLVSVISNVGYEMRMWLTCLSIAMAVMVLREAVPKRMESPRYQRQPRRPDGQCRETTLSSSSGADTVDRRRSQQARFRARMLTRSAVNLVCRCVTSATDRQLPDVQTAAIRCNNSNCSRS